jgi:hypothetical protein
MTENLFRKGVFLARPEADVEQRAKIEGETNVPRLTLAHFDTPRSPWSFVTAAFATV